MPTQPPGFRAARSTILGFFWFGLVVFDVVGPADYIAFVQDSDGDSEPEANGSAEVPDAGVDTEDVPYAILELVAACVRFVKDKVGIDLDFSSDTLPLVDHYLATVRADLDERHEATPLILRAVGAYFGEVVRRHIEGFWIVPSEDAHVWRVCSSRAFLSLNPLGAAYDALYDGKDHDGPPAALHLDKPDEKFVNARLEALPDVNEADYHRLSVRFEVIEIAIGALRDRDGADGEVTFEADDYIEPTN